MTVEKLIKFLQSQNKDLPVYVFYGDDLEPMEANKVEFCNYQFSRKKYLHETVQAHQIKIVLIT